MTTETTRNKLNYSFAKLHGVLVKETLASNTTLIAHKPGIRVDTITELRRHLGHPLQFEEVPAELFENLLTTYYQADANDTEQIMEGMEGVYDLDQLIQSLPETQDLLASQDDAPIIRLLNALFTQALKKEASDIHLETFENRVMVRFRIDGVLHEILEIQRLLSPLLISRLKVMAKLDIAEKRIPQDGRMTLRISNHTVDVRVSTIPASHGERIVLRLLDQKSAQLNLSHLGMNESTLQSTRQLIHQPHGIILVTGPTGSGKTTSLYAMLTELNESSRNILTVEDPIEYDLPGIGQTQINPKVNMTFAKGLRAILRQDPDIVMVGEIRDVETAEIAVQASLTGHLVLSTLHTNSALGAINRLRDMGVEPYLLASSLIGLIAQRLVRKLCTTCRQAKHPDETEKRFLAKANKNVETIYEPTGCNACNHTGYQGRTGIYELVVIDDKLRGDIHDCREHQVLEQYIRQKFSNIRSDGMQRVIEGITSIEEVLRVTSEL